MKKGQKKSVVLKVADFEHIQEEIEDLEDALELEKHVRTQPVSKSSLALAGYVDSRGHLTEICEGTEISTDEKYYLDRQRHVGDLHGQAPFLWAATAVIKLCENTTSIGKKSNFLLYHEP